jgi:hypothetical protein
MVYEDFSVRTEDFSDGDALSGEIVDEVILRNRAKS